MSRSQFLFRSRGLWAFGVSIFLASCGAGGGVTSGNSAGASTLGVTPAAAATAERVVVPAFYPGDTPIPVSGPNVPDAAAFDEGVKEMMRRYNVPGVGLAVARDGRLILARGYGYADFETKQFMQPDEMVRVGSISKFLTGLAVMRLRDQGLLDLDQPFLNILTEYQIQPGGDPRLRDVTVRQLLQHSGGWDKSLFDDPTNQPFTVARALGLTTPVTCRDIARYAMTQPLQFTPGTRIVYSNQGFCILGQVIAKVSGQTYESYVRDQVLAPAGVHDMSIGQPHPNQRGPLEAKYYTYDGAPMVDSVFPGEGRVAPPYAHDPLTLQAAGGWIGSAVDLTRVMTAFDGSRVANFLTPDSKQQMLADSHLPGGMSEEDPLGRWRGLAIVVGPSPESYGHGGLMPGSQATLIRDERGYTFALLTNSRAENFPQLANELVNVGTRAIDAGFIGSGTDLYSQYPSPTLPARNP
jgi:N-acyl-D-amino-acid deacylase